MTQKRQRGFILTAQGLAKLQKAKAEAEYVENAGKGFTLEAMSERTGLAVDTLMKVFACEARVDKQTLKVCFRAFNLVLESEDYYRPDLQVKSPGTNQTVYDLRAYALPAPELPEGQVPLHSAFYLDRPLIESDCYRGILQPGALIRIKAPRRMGKTSLMSRILHHASKEGYRTVYLSFQLADREIFSDLDKFLQWFCANVSREMNLSNPISKYWDGLFGSKVSCTVYFEEHLLAETNQSLILGLDDVDWLFQYPNLADDFFGLLRAWHEKAKNQEIWQKLRLVVVHSTEVYIPLNVNQSPFNVGLPVELPEFSPEQVKELAQRYQLDWSWEQVEELMALVGGHPYLVRLALYHIERQDISLKQLSAAYSTSGMEIYSDHLQRQLCNLQKAPELAEAFAKVVTAKEAVELNLVQAFKLQSMGLVRLQGNHVVPSCQLYTQYFQTYFNGLVLV